MFVFICERSLQQCGPASGLGRRVVNTGVNLWLTPPLLLSSSLSPVMVNISLNSHSLSGGACLGYGGER